ncbi:MAG: 16S rRNA (cytidine(1402)-2'-O)-methyltransferase [Candidatus Kapaibacterium sp.]
METIEDTGYSFEKYFPDYKIDKGTLYVVSTPIGNLEDISMRAVFVLKNVDMIACEDTRVTSVLLKRYNISNRLISYYSQVENKKTEYLMDELKSGKSVALVSDSGTPAISDPGSIIISKCVTNDIKVVSVPGANALIHALVLSGFENKKFYFQGFLPQKGKENVLKSLADIKMPVIIYESKYRVKKTLAELNKFFPGKNVSVSREMTKVHESVYRNRIDQMVKDLSRIKEKGEFVIVIDNS